MTGVTALRLRVAIDALQRALGPLTPEQRKTMDAFRADVARIAGLDEDERPTQPTALPEQKATAQSGVRGLWENQDEAQTPVMRPHGARKAR